MAVVNVDVAFLKVQEINNQLNSGLNPKLENLKKQNLFQAATAQLLTFKQVSEQYLLFKNLKSDRTAKIAIDKHLLQIHGLTLQQMSKQVIQSVLSPILARGNKATYNRTRAVLSAIMNYGINYLDIEAKNHIHIFKQAKLEPRNRVLSDIELISFLSTSEHWIHSKNIRISMFGAMFYLLYYSGCRINELKTLRWQNIDIDSKRFSISVENSKSGYLQIKPLTDRMIDGIQHLYKKRINDVYLFIGKDKNSHILDIRRILF